MAWAKAVDLAGKLRTMREAKAQDGEAFAVLFSNESLDSAVSLDLRLIEADQVTTPNLVQAKKTTVDGIVLDEFGNPKEYHVLKEHPGGKVTLSMQHDRVPAESMIHWFRADRSRPTGKAGQRLISARSRQAQEMVFIRCFSPGGTQSADVV